MRSSKIDIYQNMKNEVFDQARFHVDFEVVYFLRHRLLYPIWVTTVLNIQNNIEVEIYE